MIPERLEKIITLLIDKTIDKKAIWNKNSGENEYKLIVGQGSALIVSAYFGNYNREYYSVRVLNVDGESVEYYDTESEDVSDSVKLIEKFHKAAHDSYYKVDETMESLLGEIKRQDVVGIKEDYPPYVPIAPSEEDLPF